MGEANNMIRLLDVPNKVEYRWVNNSQICETHAMRNAKWFRPFAW